MTAVTIAVRRDGDAWVVSDDGGRFDDARVRERDEDAERRARADAQARVTRYRSLGVDAELTERGVAASGRDAVAIEVYLDEGALDAWVVSDGGGRFDDARYEVGEHDSCVVARSLAKTRLTFYRAIGIDAEMLQTMTREESADATTAVTGVLPEDLYSDRARGRSASMPLLSDLVPFVALHLAGQAFSRQVTRRWPPDDRTDVPTDLDLRTCRSYFDLRARAIRRRCLACGVEHARRVTSQIRADWSLAPADAVRFARVSFDDLVEFHRTHDACRPPSSPEESGATGEVP